MPADGPAGRLDCDLGDSHCFPPAPSYKSVEHLGEGNNQQACLTFTSSGCELCVQTQTVFTECHLVGQESDEDSTVTKASRGWNM